MEQQKNIFAEKEAERIPDPAELRVSSKGDVNKLASAIVAKIREHGYTKVRGIGDPSIGKGFRASSIALGRLLQADMDFVMTGAFFDVILKDRDSGEEKVKSGSIINIDPR